MMLDATQNYTTALTEKRLFAWHASLFPTGYSGMRKIAVGRWRDDSGGPLQVVSGALGHERVHFEAPAAKQLRKEMSAFLKWFNGRDETDPVLRAGIAHLWFVTIHPFADGNGRIARAIADMALARSEQSVQRFYSMSAQIRAERKAYYEMLEKTQKNGLDVTKWLEWFLGCLDRAFDDTEATLGNVLRKARFWDAHRSAALNDRQREMLNKVLNGFEGKLTSSKWAKMTKCSQDTALRDILDLVDRGILSKDPGGGRSTSYSLVQPANE
jgi:Fic family protein